MTGAAAAAAEERHHREGGARLRAAGALRQPQAALHLRPALALRQGKAPNIKYLPPIFPLSTASLGADTSPTLLPTATSRYRFLPLVGWAYMLLSPALCLSLVNAIYAIFWFVWTFVGLYKTTIPSETRQTDLI